MNREQKLCCYCGVPINMTKGKLKSKAKYLACKLPCPKRYTSETYRIEIKERLLKKVVKQEDEDLCWSWTAMKNEDGYGCHSFAGESTLAHRVSWIVHNGPIPYGLYVLHKCDNRQCVNPKHLFLGTQKENVHDMRAKGRRIWNGNKGMAHPLRVLTVENVLEIRKLHAAGGVTFRALSKQFEVGETQIRRIVRRERWATV